MGSKHCQVASGINENITWKELCSLVRMSKKLMELNSTLHSLVSYKIAAKKQSVNRRKLILSFSDLMLPVRILSLL